MTALAFLVALASGAGAVHLLRRRIFLATVRGISMQPALQPGDRLIMRRATLAGVRPGDVVVLERPDAGTAWTRPPVRRLPDDRELLIKRAVAVPGNRIPAALTGTQLTGDRVPPGCLVVLGDNGAHSFDSRQIGYIPAERLLGVGLRPLRRTRLPVRRASSSGRRMRGPSDGTAFQTGTLTLGGGAATGADPDPGHQAVEPPAGAGALAGQVPGDRRADGRAGAAVPWRASGTECELYRPATVMAAGTSSGRTTVASRATARTRPRA